MQSAPKTHAAQVEASSPKAACAVATEPAHRASCSAWLTPPSQPAATAPTSAVSGKAFGSPRLRLDGDEGSVDNPLFSPFSLGGCTVHLTPDSFTLNVDSATDAVLADHDSFSPRSSPGVPTFSGGAHFSPSLMTNPMASGCTPMLDPAMANPLYNDPQEPADTSAQLPPASSQTASVGYFMSVLTATVSEPVPCTTSFGLRQHAPLAHMSFVPDPSQSPAGTDGMALNQGEPEVGSFAVPALSPAAMLSQSPVSGQPAFTPDMDETCDPHLQAQVNKWLINSQDAAEAAQKLPAPDAESLSRSSSSEVEAQMHSWLTDATPVAELHQEDQTHVAPVFSTIEAGKHHSSMPSVTLCWPERQHLQLVTLLYGFGWTAKFGIEKIAIWSIIEGTCGIVCVM